jgi:hypothetical protein
MFECRQLQRLANHEVSEEEARQRIADVQRRVASIEQLLQELGHTAVHLPLGERYAQVLSSETSAVLAHLVAEMEALHAILNRDFRLEPIELMQNPE